MNAQIGNGNNVGATKVTLLLLTYNQNKFVREALDCLFNQSYETSQIIIADDCSTDGTAETIHRYLLNVKVKDLKFLTNNYNVGIAEQLNKCISIATGEIVVIFAGDDASSMRRVSDIVKAFDSDEQTMLAFSNAIILNEIGEGLKPYFNEPPRFCESLDDFLVGISPWALGATVAIRRSLFTDFGPVPKNVKHEDGVFAFWAILKGKVVYINSGLVKYRVHNGSVSNFINIKNYIRLKVYEHELVEYRYLFLLDRLPFRHDLIAIAKRKYLKSRIYKFLHQVPFLPNVYYVSLKFMTSLSRFGRDS